MVDVSSCSVGSRSPGASLPPRISALSRDSTFSARLLERLSAIEPMVARQEVVRQLRQTTLAEAGCDRGSGRPCSPSASGAYAPAMPGTIRRATDADRARISEIRFAVKENILRDRSRVTDEMVTWFIDNPGIWLWDEDGKVLGFSAADTRDGTIFALFIDPAHEGRGIGRALLGRACDVLREAGHRSATLGTQPG